MIALYAAFAAVTVVAVGLLAWPLLRRRQDLAPDVARTWIAGAAVVLFAAGTYALLGRPAASLGADDDSPLAALLERTRNNPDDVDAWDRLGALYGQRGQLSLAQQAYERADRLAGGRDPDSLAGLGELAMQSTEQAASARALSLFNEALKYRPEDQRSLFFSSVLLIKLGDPVEARARLNRMLRPELPDHIRELITKQIHSLDVQIAAGVTGAGALSAGNPAAGPASATGSPPVDTASAVHIKVDIAPALKARVPQGASLFVFVRNTNPGPPLAVKRMPVTFPVSLTLSAADAMIQGNAIQPGQLVTVAARVSANGSPQGGSGDFYGDMQVKAGQTTVHELRISKTQP